MELKPILGDMLKGTIMNKDTKPETPKEEPKKDDGPRLTYYWLDDDPKYNSEDED